MMRVHQQIDRRTAAVMKAHNLSVGRFDVLNHTGLHEGCTQQELADKLFVTKGNVTQLLDGMEADGLLYRRRKGRTNLIYLTDVGQQLRQAAMADQLANIADAMAALSPDELTTLQTLLRKIDRSLQESDSQS